MPIPYEFVRYSLGRGGMPGRTFVLNLESIFILLLCTHINKKMGFGGGGGGLLCSRFICYCPSVMMPGFGSLV